MMSAMTSFLRKYALLLLVAAALFVPQRLLAAGEQCAAQGGTCNVAGLSSEDKGALDCTAPQHCFVPSSGTAVSCESQGSVCKAACGANEQNIGQFSCQAGFACCKSKALVPTTPTGSSGATTPAAGQGTTVKQVDSPDRLVLPSCTKDGSCQLDDIVQTGINFATFIMGLSGALFFAVFIYGGALYLASFGNKSRVESGKKAIKGAVIGMVFVLGAWTIVNTLSQGLRYGKSPGDTTQTTNGTLKPEEKCPAQGPEYSCVTLTGKTTQEAKTDGDNKGYSCLTGLCPGAANILCCKQK